MRNIPFVKKKTQATTQYNEIRSVDLNWILMHANRLIDVANDCANNGVKEGQALIQPNPKLPRQSSGTRNSPKSMCEGVFDNFNKGQYDLSTKQMEGLVESFRIGNNVIEDFDDVEFQEVEKLPKLSYAGPKPALDTLLFDLDSVTMTYRRKQHE